MKNQTDLIVTVVAVLCMLIGVGVAFGTKGVATKQQPPAQVVVTPLQLPAGDVVMAASLPGGGGGGGGAAGGPAGFGGMGGGRPSGIGATGPVGPGPSGAANPGGFTNVPSPARAG